MNVQCFECRAWDMKRVSWESVNPSYLRAWYQCRICGIYGLLKYTTALQDLDIKEEILFEATDKIPFCK